MFSTDFSLYSHKALYVHPKALNGDSKASDVRSKPSNGGQKLLIVTTHVMGCWLVIFIPPSTKNLNNINFLCISEYIYYFCRYISKNRLPHEYTAVRHIINKSPWENILKYGGYIQILLVCIHYADTCQRGLPSYGVSPITSAKRWTWCFSMCVKRLKSVIIPMDLTLA